jgi:hypothetical protein
LLNHNFNRQIKGGNHESISSIEIYISLVLYSGETLSESGEICCSRVNSKYETGQLPQKITFRYDGTYATYNTESSTDAFTKETFTIDKKWTSLTGQFDGMINDYQMEHQTA